jgi:ubiquinone biosynthesis O-methyltransferase
MALLLCASQARGALPSLCARHTRGALPSLCALLSHRRASSTLAAAAAAAAAPTGGSVDAAEVGKFSALAGQWWADPANGPFAGLHRLNAVRVPLIRRALSGDFLPRRRAAAAAAAAAAGEADLAPCPGAPLAGLDVLDVGCGGGILSEALARLGARVTGLDASPQVAAAAAAHAALDPALARRTRYLASSAEALAASGAQYDAVVCSEVLEHVAEPAPFVAALAALARPGGHVVVTTINRTLPALWGAVLAAEYVLRLVPPGTHEWGKFVQPEELAAALRAGGCDVEQCVGMAYNPLSGAWSQSASTSINYAMVARKREAGRGDGGGGVK